MILQRKKHFVTTYFCLLVVLLFSFENRGTLDARHVLFSVADLSLCPVRMMSLFFAPLKDGTAATCTVSRQKCLCQTAQYKSVAKFPAMQRERDTKDTLKGFRKNALSLSLL
ncbi:hypothetical protein AMECASPLE_028534 [Ameca splendens]|uniref:Secreted protein n=1 Tax=Ameca splendens TaxID=208324 RepID=A0ABV0XIP5_9TELE